MNWTEAFLVLGIEATKEERALKNAYREKLASTNPEDDPEGFKRLRKAYEEACKYAAGAEEAIEPPRDTSPSGLWAERAAEIYGNIRTRQDVELWKALFHEDVFLALEEEENCRQKLLAFLAKHYRLPTEVWKLFDRKLSISGSTKALREKFPANFVYFIADRCERGEELAFGQFEGAEDADYDLFLEYYDHCWQAIQKRNLEEAELCLRNADGTGITHPVAEVSRANLLARRGRAGEAVALFEELLARYPKDAMLSYNFAEMLWAIGGEGDYSAADKLTYWGELPRCGGDGTAYRSRAAELYSDLKGENNSHYMANIRLTEWHFGQKRYRDAKKCAEKVLAYGGSEEFMQLLGKINGEIERELEARCRESFSWEPALEVCWCYLQDGKVARGIALGKTLEAHVPPEKKAEYRGLMTKLYVEQAEYEDAIAMSQGWESALREKIEKRESADEKEEKRDKDRLRQIHLLRMQCYHNLGFSARENFALAIREADHVLTGGMKDVGILLEIAQIHLETEEYGQCLEITQKLVDEFQVYTAHTIALEVYRRQLNAAGVVRAAGQSIHYYPTFVKSYEYLAKVYLDLGRREDLKKVLADAEQNDARSVILEAYRFQMDHAAMEIGELNKKLKNFRQEFLKPVEKGEPDAYEKGLPILTEYLYHYPDDFMLVERAAFHRAAHRYEEAEQDYEKALFMNTANPYALNGLSFVHKYKGDYEKALFFLKRAILYKDDEMSAVLYADMGNLYAILGIPDMAVESYRQYRELSGKVTVRWFHDNLAEYHLRAGQVQEAVAVCAGYYQRSRWVRYEKLTALYRAAGAEAQARHTLRQWEKALRANMVAAVRRVLVSAETVGPDVSLYIPYNHSKGWTELLFGSKSGAMSAFGKTLRGGKRDEAREGMKPVEELICDAVFACILCGDDRRGKRYAQKLQLWLRQERQSGGRKYYSRERRHLYMECLAAWYAEPAETLQEFLDQGGRSAICHTCTRPLCAKLEAARILLLLREGEREEARQRLDCSLEQCPWDDGMAAIRRIAFAEGEDSRLGQSPR